MKANKQSGFLGVLSAAALAALAAIPAAIPANVQAARQETTVNQNQNKQQSPVQAPTSSQVINSLPTHLGAVALGGKNSNFGIAPHIYGMYHVRRGTHKKTNRK